MVHLRHTPAARPYIPALLLSLGIINPEMSDGVVIRIEAHQTVDMVLGRAVVATGFVYLSISTRSNSGSRQQLLVAIFAIPVDDAGSREHLP